MNDILEMMIVLAVIILPIMLVVLKVVHGISRLNLNDYFLIATF